MKSLFLAGVAMGLAAPALPLTGAVNPDAIQRCETTDGSVIYTDRACAAFGSRAVPLSSEVLGRIARDASSTSTVITLAGNTAKRRPVIARRSPQSGCARTPTQLSMDIQGSLALGDVNRLAESYHWVGQSHRQAIQLMHRLEALTEESLLDARFHDARIGPGHMQLAGPGWAGGAAGIMQLNFANASNPRVIDFQVLRFSGCYFVRF